MFVYEEARSTEEIKAAAGSKSGISNQNKWMAVHWTATGLLTAEGILSQRDRGCQARAENICRQAKRAAHEADIL